MSRIKWQAKCNKCQTIVSESYDFKSLTQIRKEVSRCKFCGVKFDKN